MSEQTPHKYNNAAVGAVLAAIIGGLPLITFYEKKITEQTKVSETLKSHGEKLASLQARDALLQDAIDKAEQDAKDDLQTDSAILHKRVTELGKDVDAKLEKSERYASDDRRRVEGRIWTVEGLIRALEKEVAVMHAKDSHE